MHIFGNPRTTTKVLVQSVAQSFKPTGQTRLVILNSRGLKDFRLGFSQADVDGTTYFTIRAGNYAELSGDALIGQIWVRTEDAAGDTIEILYCDSLDGLAAGLMS
jgi:hypothetical protein